MRRLLFNIALCMLWTGAPAMAEPAQDFTFKGLYKCTLSGIVFGKIGLEVEQDARGYAGTADLMSAGVLDYFTKHSSHTTVDGAGKNYTYPQVEYETHYRTKNKRRHVKINYKNGVFHSEALDPPENPAKRPSVPVNQKKEAKDPLSLLIYARLDAIRALQGGETTYRIPVYDGRRLTEVTFTLKGRQTIRQHDRKIPVVVVTAQRKALAGFTASELEDIDESEPPLFIYFSDDDTFFPIRLEVRLMFGTISANLVKRCTGSESCLLGNRE